MRAGIILLAACLFLNSCGKPDNFGEFNELVFEFRNKSEQYGRNISLSHLSIEFADMPDEKSGKCESSFFGSTISINRRLWNIWPNSTRESILFHELGHCVLGRGHIEEFNFDGTPTSIMTPNAAIVPLDHDELRDSYFLELFTRS